MQIRKYSNGFGFNFVPLRSALDYGGDIYSGTQSPVLEGTPPATVMSNTPMDVVLAVPERAQNPQTLLFNYNHSNLYNPRLFWKYNPVPDPIYYRSCSTASILKYSRLLNREIGAEKLYLENFFQLFPQAHYRTEYDIYVNERNPAYQYPNFIDPDLHEPGAFSDEEIFELGEGRADFFSDQSEAQNFAGRDWSDGFLYNPPQEPLPQWDDWNEPYFICCGE